MIIVPVKEGENIEKALKKFKRKFEIRFKLLKSLLVCLHSLRGSIPLISLTYSSCAPTRNNKSS